MTQRKILSCLLLVFLVFSLAAPAYAAVEPIVGVPFSDAPSPEDVFKKSGFASDILADYQAYLAGASMDEFCNYVLFDFGENWATHPSASNRYCYVFSGMPIYSYNSYFGYDTSFSEERWTLITSYADFRLGAWEVAIDDYNANTGSFIFHAPYAVIWSDGSLDDLYVAADTYTDPAENTNFDLPLNDPFVFLNESFDYDMALAVYNGAFSDFPVILNAESYVYGSYSYRVFEEGSTYVSEFTTSRDFVYGDGLEYPEGGFGDLTGVENRLDTIINNQETEIGLLGLLKGYFADFAESVKALPDAISDAISNSFMDMELVPGDGEEEPVTGRNFFDMVVDIIKTVADLLGSIAQGLIEFFQSIVQYIAAIGEVVIEYLLSALVHLVDILDLILNIPEWISALLGFLPEQYQSFISMCVSVLFIVILIRFAINIIK